MNFNTRLRDIASSLQEYEGFLYTIILKAMYSIISEKTKGRHAAIVCGGKHTEFLKCDFSTLLSGCDIIDKEPDEVRKKYFTVYVSSYDKVNDYEVLLISSYVNRNSVKQKLEEQHYGGCIVDMYEELWKRGICLSREYYLYKEDTYGLLITGRKLYSAEMQLGKKQQILAAIILQFIKNKDLLQAKKYVKLYIEEGYSDRKKFKLILEELEQLEMSISDVLHARKQRDVICFWHDDLRYATSNKLSYLNKCREGGINFLNAYGASMSTRTTYGCMMERTDEIALFLHDRVDNQLTKMLKENGYKAMRIGGKGSCERLEEFDYQHTALVDYTIPTTTLYWEMLNVLVTEEAPLFILVHTLLETHPPFCAPTMSEYSYEYQNEEFRYESAENMQVFEQCVFEAAEYLDEENEYIGALLSENVVRIYMSDHGCFLNRESRAYKEEVAHIPFTIVGAGIPHIVEKRLFCLRKFYDVMYYIISLDKYEEICEDYLQINGIDLYGEDCVRDAIDRDMAEAGLQFVGVRTLRDMYVYRATGEECYYVLPNEGENIVCNADYGERISKLKLLLKREMIDINKVDKFRYSHRLYEHIGKTIHLL